MAQIKMILREQSLADLLTIFNSNIVSNAFERDKIWREIQYRQLTTDIISREQEQDELAESERTKIVGATFNGKNGSLGYWDGQRYLLEITQMIAGGIFIRDVSEDNKKTARGERVLYESVFSFLDNWTDIDTYVSTTEAFKSKRKN